MSTMYKNGREYSFKSDEDVDALIRDMKDDLDFQQSLYNFDPGIWITQGADGRPLRDAEVEPGERRLTQEDMQRYARAFDAIDKEALRARQQARIERMMRGSADPINSRGSLGEPWDAERG